MKKNLVALAVLAALASSSYASSSGGVPGNCGNGQGSGNACTGQQTTPSAGSSVTNVNNVGSTSNSSSNSVSGSKATSSSTSSSSVTGSGNSTSKSGVRNSGNSSSTSSVTGSGNSTNRVRAQGGAGGAGGSATVGNVTGGSVGDVSPTQTNSQSNSQVNGQTNNQSLSINNPKPVAASAYAPTIVPTATCAAGTSIGLQGTLGFSFGKTDIVESCEIMEQAKAELSLGNTKSANEVMCELPRVRQARLRSGTPCWADTEAGKQATAAAEVKAGYTGTDPIVRRRLGLPALSE